MQTLGDLRQDDMQLFTPFTFPGGAVVANRLVVAPMTTTQSEPDGHLSVAEARWLTRLAADHYGMVITCAAAISRSSIAFANQLSLQSEAHAASLAPLAATMRSHGTLPVVQLCHGGSRALPQFTGEPARSASAYKLPDVPSFVSPLPFSHAQILGVIDDHAVAAQRAAQAGFGGIELHGANGYLFTQFLSTQTNLRADAWGGSLAHRARLLREVVQAIRIRVPRPFVVGVRLSFENLGLQTGLDLDENVQVARWIAQDGADYVHISGLDLFAPSQKYPDGTVLSHVYRSLEGALPIIAAGGVGSQQAACEALDAGGDLVSIARAAIGNDRIPQRFAAGEALIAPPWSPQRLLDLQVSPAFLGYLTGDTPVARMNLVAGGAAAVAAHLVRGDTAVAAHLVTGEKKNDE